MPNPKTTLQDTPSGRESLPVLIADRPGLQALLARAAAEPTVAVDTESNSLYAYHHRICLIQLSLPHADYVIDPLAVDASPLAELFANPHCQKVFHAAENDVLGLQRDFGFHFANLFDTMLAARILGWPHAGLAAILDERFGVKLDKRLQRANWGRRPLPPDLLAYAGLDTHYLLPLRSQQVEELRRRGRWTEAQEGFDRLPLLQWVDKPFDPEGFWRINGVRDLSPAGQSILRQLYLFREAEASRWDLPPFKLLGESTMVAISRREPQTLQDLRQVKGIGDSQLRRLGRGLLAAVAEGQALPLPRPPRRPRDGNGRPDPATEARYAALRNWRTERARARGVDPDVVLTNDVLMALARQAPDSREALAATEMLAPSKLQEYGESILQVLQQA